MSFVLASTKLFPFINDVAEFNQYDKVNDPKRKLLMKVIKGMYPKYYDNDPLNLYPDERRDTIARGFVPGHYSPQGGREEGGWGVEDGPCGWLLNPTYIDIWHSNGERGWHTKWRKDPCLAAIAAATVDGRLTYSIPTVWVGWQPPQYRYDEGPPDQSRGYEAFVEHPFTHRRNGHKYDDAWFLKRGRKRRRKAEKQVLREIRTGNL